MTFEHETPDMTSDRVVPSGGTSFEPALRLAQAAVGKPDVILHETPDGRVGIILVEEAHEFRDWAPSASR